MPIVVNSNASATSASFNLSRANDSLRNSSGTTCRPENGLTTQQMMRAG